MKDKHEQQEFTMRMAQDIGMRVNEMLAHGNYVGAALLTEAAPEGIDRQPLYAGIALTLSRMESEMESEYKIPVLEQLLAHYVEKCDYLKPQNQSSSQA